VPDWWGRPTQLDRIENSLYRIERDLEEIKRIPRAGMTAAETDHVTKRLINAAMRLKALLPK
jgi:hypothetical protein